MTPRAARGYALGMRISFSTATFYAYSLAYSLRLARDTGFDGVELALGVGYQLGGPQNYPRRYLRAIRAVGMPVLSVHPPFLRLRVGGWPLAVVHRMMNLTSVAHLVDAPIAVAHVPALRSKDSPRAQRFAQAIALGYDHVPGGVTMTLETSQYAGRPMHLLDDVHALVDFAGEHGCGITLDTCHAGANGEDLLATYEAVRPLLRNVHLSDARAPGQDGQEMRTHLMPGEGTLPLRELLAQMRHDGYDGLVTLELHPREVGYLGRHGQAQRLRQASEFVRSAIDVEREEMVEH